MRLREPKLPSCKGQCQYLTPSGVTPEWSHNDVSLQSELVLTARLSRMFAVILLWFCLYALDVSLVKNTRESSPFFTFCFSTILS